jgi:acetyl esterase/lipase
VSVGGISAGGFLAAVIQQIARDKDVELKLGKFILPAIAVTALIRIAILAVPCTIRMERYNNPLKYPWGSLEENALAPTLNAKRLDFFADLVRKSAGYEEHYDKLPIFWKDPIYGSLEGVCDTFVVTASCDPIRDDGEAYAAKLIATGTKVTARRYTGVPHPFMHYPGVKKKEMYDRDTCGLLKVAHDL